MKTCKLIRMLYGIIGCFLLFSCDNEEDFSEKKWDSIRYYGSPLELTVIQDSVGNYTVVDSINVTDEYYDYAYSDYHVHTNNLNGHLEFSTAKDKWLMNVFLNDRYVRELMNWGIRYANPVIFHNDWCDIFIEERTIKCDFKAVDNLDSSDRVLIQLTYYPDTTDVYSRQFAQIIIHPADLQ